MIRRRRFPFIVAFSLLTFRLILSGISGYAQNALLSNLPVLPQQPSERTGQEIAALDTPTSELIVFLYPTMNAQVFALTMGLRPVYALRSDGNAWVFTTASAETALRLLPQIAAHPAVRRVYPNLRTHLVAADFVPNDPYFPLNGGGEGQPGQWHLINSVTPGLDAGVKEAWRQNLLGQGIVIGLIDDCLEITHPDLAPNVSTINSYDFGQNDANPSPVNNNDRHGVCVAGLMAARGGNGIGVTGIAPFASLAGLRIDFPKQTLAMFLDATRYQSVGETTAIKVKNHSYTYTLPYIFDSGQSDAVAESAASGTIHCFAAGNFRTNATQDSNKLDTQNSPDVITVAAMGSHGKFANYSNFGACVFVTAPSSSAGFNGITTTDRTGNFGYNNFPDANYTDLFGGTSAATPLVSGALTLIKQIQPALNVRFAKHLLARCSDIVDPADATVFSDGGWKTNGAGLKFNQNYGFGKINAGRLIQAATLYTGVTPLETESTGSVIVNAVIPDNDSTGISRTFSLHATQPLEEVLVTLHITHPNRGNLSATLRSPSGTTSRLVMNAANDRVAGLDWTFSSNAFWGENPEGVWTLTVYDLGANDTGIWNAFEVTVRMGTLVPRTLSGTVLLEEVADANVPVTFTFRPTSGEPFSRETMLAPTGAFELSSLPAGDYTLTVKGTKWLRKSAGEVNISEGSFSGVSVLLLGGDANDDNVVDVLDIDLLISAFDSTPSDPHWNNAADFNSDGSVDVLDLALLIRNFDTEGDSD